MPYNPNRELGRFNTGGLAVVARTHSNARNVPVVVYQTPLMTRKIQFEDMVVDFVSVLVKASEGVDPVVTTISDRGIDKTCRPLAEGSCDFRSVAIHHSPVLQRRIWHNKCVSGGGSGDRGRGVGVGVGVGVAIGNRRSDGRCRSGDRGWQMSRVDRASE